MGPLAVVDERRALRDVTPSAALMRAAEGDDEGSKEFYFFGGDVSHGGVQAHGDGGVRQKGGRDHL